MARNNYPLSSTEGIPIPLDVFEPSSTLDPINISTSALGSSEVISSYETVVLEIWSTVPARIGFNLTPVNGTTEPGVYILRPDEPVWLIPTNGYLSGLSLSGSGTLYCNILVRYDALRKDYQTSLAE